MKDFGIRYVISDYDLNLAVVKINEKYETLSRPILNSSPISILISGKTGNLKYFRFLPAAFNRNNTCNISISILEKQSGNQMASNELKCSDLRNYMYQTAELNVQLNSNADYVIKISSNSHSENNSIALAEDKRGNPFAELLFDTSTSNKTNDFKLLFHQKNIYVSEVPQSSIIIFNGRYGIIDNKSEKVTLRTFSDSLQIMEIKIPYYPGWNATIDGREVKIEDGKPFVKINIPGGDHIVSIVYTPYSFILGFGITGLTVLGILIFIIRKEREQLWWKKRKVNYFRWARVIQKNISVKEHIVVFISGLTLGTFTYYVLLKSIKISFKMPKTTAINWLTVHHYPKQQDYFYYYSGFSYIFFFVCLFWLVWVWIRTKK